MKNTNSCGCIFKLILLLLITVIGGDLVVSAMTLPSQRKNEINVAILGNSMLYFNDCPRLLEQMLRTKYSKVRQDSCLRPYVSLSGLWEKGNGMHKIFGNHPNAQQSDDDDDPTDIGSPTVRDLFSQQQHWDYIILNDHSQYPARSETRMETQTTLRQHYAPLFSSKRIIPVFLQTCAYRKPVNNSNDLGSVKTFTKKIYEGYMQYLGTFEEEKVPNTLLAPVGDAFLWLHEHDNPLWNKLFHTDDFHPSPFGTWLQACVLYCTIVKEPPPMYQSEWFARARHSTWHHPEDLPSAEDAEALRRAACAICHTISQE